MVALGLAAISLTVIVLLVVLSAFFSSTEIAIFSLSPDWIDEMRTTGDGRATILGTLREDPHRLLVTILVGNNLVNMAISSITTVLVVSFLPPGLAVIVATLVASVIVLVFGEIIPKSFGLGNARTWAMTAAGPLQMITYVLSPIAWVFDVATRRASSWLGGDQAIERPYTD